MFKSNNCVAIHLTDIGAAENFYTNVMKFRLLARSEEASNTIPDISCSM